jgi:hypothetical protein
MDFIPPRSRGALLGGLFLALVLGAVIFGVIKLATAPISAWIILWVSLPVTGVPLALLIVFRLYGLLTARYWLDRDGFYLTWGLASEQIPLAAVTQIRAGREVASRLLPNRGLFWPGCVVGRGEIEEVGSIEFFATTGTSGLIVMYAGDRLLAISPPDPEVFQQAFLDATRMGSLEHIDAHSQRPDFMVARLWADLVARVLVLTGLCLPLLLLGYLAVRAPSLPTQVPFGFNPSGAPDPMAPPGRLLLLPMIGGLCWLADLVIGAWTYRREQDRPLAYAIWAAAVLVGGLFWGATFHLLAAV